MVESLLGGWSFSPLFTCNSGTPILFSDYSVVAPGSPKLEQPTRQAWFDVSKFAKQTAFTPRTNPWYYAGLNGPRQWNLDSTLSKSFRIMERLRAELRMEAYNLTNSILWANPNMAIDSALFGKVLRQSNRGREFQYTLRVHF
jgi:hypothetical protein